MSGNFLLDSLEPEDLARLKPRMTKVVFNSGDILFEPESPADQVYFPRTGLLSVISILINGDSVETSTVGREGGVGFIEASDGGVVYSHVVVQGDGEGWRCDAATWRAAFEASRTLRGAVHRHIELLLAEARQEIACHALHKAPERLARWLLVSADKTGTTRINLSQEFLAALIAAQRTTVSGVAAKLKREGLIHYTRGRIDLRDPAGLERRACECYATMKHLRRQMGQPTGALEDREEGLVAGTS